MVGIDVADALVVAGPAVVEQGVEREAEVGAGEDDEVEVAEEEPDLGCDGAEAETYKMAWLVVER
jgi:hypothetical protein